MASIHFIKLRLIFYYVHSTEQNGSSNKAADVHLEGASFKFWERFYPDGGFHGFPQPFYVRSGRIP